MRREFDLQKSISKYLFIKCGHIPSQKKKKKYVDKLTKAATLTDTSILQNELQVDQPKPVRLQLIQRNQYEHENQDLVLSD